MQTELSISSSRISFLPFTMHPCMQRQFLFFSWLCVHKRKSSQRRMTNTVKIQEDRGIIRVGGNLISVLINRSLSGAA